MVYTYNGLLFSLKKGENNAIFDNMDVPRQHYVKWISVTREKQILYAFIYVTNLKLRVKFRAESIMVVACR